MEGTRNVTAFTVFAADPFIFAVGVALLAVVVPHVIDRTQRRHAIRGDCPVIGRLRSFFLHAGELFRRCFFALDRALEEDGRSLPIDYRESAILARRPGETTAMI